MTRLLPGTKVVLLDKSGSTGFRRNYKGPTTLTECSIYVVKNYFCYLNTTTRKYDEFITLLNDKGKCVKCNLKRFKVL